MSFTNPDKNIEQLNLSEGFSVVIFGSGAGGHSFATARALKGTGRVFAIDVRGDMLSKLKSDAMKQNLTNITPVLGNVELPQGSKQSEHSIDVVIIPNTLFAYDDKPAILKEAFRILKPEGRLLIIDWRSSFSNMGPAQKDIVSQQESMQLAKDAGFTFMQNINAGTYHYGILLTKKV
jgi:ubiquinone/menaquinone biosynthesis C-methylase UbiE